MRPGSDRGFPAAAETLFRVVDELIDVHAQAGARRPHFELHANLLGSFAAYDPMGHFAGAHFFLEVLRQGVERGGVQLLSDDSSQLMEQARADLIGGIRLQVGGPTLPGDDHRFHGVTRIDIVIGVLRCGKEQTAQK